MYECMHNQVMGQVLTDPPPAALAVMWRQTMYTVYYAGVSICEIGKLNIILQYITL